MRVAFPFIAWFFVPCAEGMVDCIGTCYTGRLLPSAQDISHGKHLKGFSYKNITTDDMRKCYAACAQDCRCKACQMKNAKCELLDEDKTSKADNFVAESGYVYYDLKQIMYQGKSHMLPPGVCHNGCCKSQPCMNKGTCIEHCQSPKKKFSCECPVGFYGKLCEHIYYSCKDVLRKSQTQPESGIYTITRSDRTAVHFAVHCDFEGPNLAWTLIESFALSKKSEFQDPFLEIAGGYLTIDATKDYWSAFRQRPARIEYLRSKSTLFRATCDFPKRNGTLTPDLLIGNLSDVDIFMTSGPTSCKKFKFIDIRGYHCTDCTAFTYQGSDYHFHLDVTYSKWCDFNPPPAKFNVDSFGYYETIDSISECTKTPQSTTQWWLGEEI